MYQGGALRNIPVGGGSRKNTKRSSNTKRSNPDPNPDPLSQPAGLRTPPPPQRPRQHRNSSWRVMGIRIRPAYMGGSGPGQEDTGYGRELQLVVGIKRAVWEYF
ncbi:hypothetical protein NC652_008160 [Populus alba x Populus x berolinensis]|nr:hypothetical protein NC652_008160 [Populus alba x Populus x berolinensis]